MLKEAGLDRINHNLNGGRCTIITTSVPLTHLNNALLVLKMLGRRLGFEICSGGIIGTGRKQRSRGRYVTEGFRRFISATRRHFQSTSFFGFREHP